MELSHLQALISKDARSYREDFGLQYEHFQSELAIFVLNPSAQHAKFGNLVNFISSVAHLYRDHPHVKVAIVFFFFLLRERSKKRKKRVTASFEANGWRRRRSRVF